MICSHPDWIGRFEEAMAFDNCEAVTLKPRPELWDYQGALEEDLESYLDSRDCNWVLFPERGEAGNLHYHGIIIFPFDKVRRNFQRWFNRFYGTVHRSPKGNPEGWMNYCMKNIPEVQYLFDPIYEPQADACEAVHG